METINFEELNNQIKSMKEENDYLLGQKEEIIKSTKIAEEKLISLGHSKDRLSREIMESEENIAGLVEHSERIERGNIELKNIKDELSSEVKIAEIRLRKEQYSGDLNRREKGIRTREEHSDTRQIIIEKSEDLLKKKSDDLDSATRKMNESRIRSERLNHELVQKINVLNQKEEYVDLIIGQKNVTISSNVDLKNKLQNQINYHIGKSRELEVIIAESKKSELEISNLKNDLDERIRTLNDKTGETKKYLEDAKENNLILIKEISDAKKEKDHYEKSLYEMRAQENNIKLGWLKLNKRAKDLGVESEIEKLENK